MYINSIIHLDLISRRSQVYFCFYKQNIVFEVNVTCLMDKNGNLCPSKNVTLAYQHVSYLENDLVLMAHFFTTLSFCKYVYIKQQNIHHFSLQMLLFDRQSMTIKV